MPDSALPTQGTAALPEALTREMDELIRCARHADHVRHGGYDWATIDEADKALQAAKSALTASLALLVEDGERWRVAREGCLLVRGPGSRWTISVEGHGAGQGATPEAAIDAARRSTPGAPTDAG